MPIYKYVQVSLADEIRDAAMAARFHLRQGGVQPDIHFEKTRRIKPAWRFTCAYRNGVRDYVLLDGALYGEWHDIGVLSPKGQSAKGVNISGLSLADRKNVIAALEKMGR